MGDTLKTYGTVKSVRKQTYISSPEIYTGTQLLSIVLTSTPPRYITIDGYPCRLWYRGQPLVCNLCGVQGHKSAACPNRDKCRRCGQSGHFARNCPNPWGNAAVAPQVPAVDDVEYPPLSSQETPSWQGVPEISTCEPSNAPEDPTQEESEVPTPSETPVLFAEPEQFENAFTTEDQWDEHLAIEQDGCFDQYLPVREVTVSDSGYIRTAPAAAAPNSVAEVTPQDSCAQNVSVIQNVSPAPQSVCAPETSQNVHSNSVNNVNVVTGAVAENGETAVNLSDNAASQGSDTVANPVNPVNVNAASKESATAVNVNDSNNAVSNEVNSSAASKRSVTAKGAQTKPVDKPNAAPKRSVTAKDPLNNSSTGGTTVINCNHVSENVVDYNHGEVPMEISSSSDTL